MAQGLLANALPQINVRSAGIGALIGHHADPIAIELMEAKGIDIASHIARQISPSICNASNLILVMDEEQKKFIENNFRSTRGKVFRLSMVDVPDPYRRSKYFFEDVLRQIEDASQHWIARIEKIVSQEKNI
ncbi:protein-tyrosine phosphatase [Variovorax ginsengisoli]|uniref:protein-tyrosine-phosphatase n=2 Tax=Variovorax ginsengisoli TaxID=363844 RepID=A0ABT9SCY4_9BURK|nr:protein-tyrosine phosphatase [Variovorax ginsengisoli]